MSADRDIRELLLEIGFSGQGALVTARAAIDAAGITNPKRARVSSEKVLRIRKWLSAKFVRACRGEPCRRALSGTRPEATVVIVESPLDCEHCEGSANQRAMKDFVRACEERGVTRVVVVGGSPGVREELRALFPARLELSLVDGTVSRSMARAKADCGWAHMVLIWGPSELSHKVSRLYTDLGRPFREKVVQAKKRGVAGLLDAGTAQLGKLRLG